MTIRDLADKYGVMKLASKLNISDVTLYNWMNHKHLPRPHHMKEITKLSGNKITFASLVRDYLKHNEKLN